MTDRRNAALQQLAWKQLWKILLSPPPGYDSARRDKTADSSSGDGGSSEGHQRTPVGTEVEPDPCQTSA